jgi:hypothetical protein
MDFTPERQPLTTTTTTNEIGVPDFIFNNGISPYSISPKKNEFIKKNKIIVSKMINLNE